MKQWVVHIGAVGVIFTLFAFNASPAVSQAANTQSAGVPAVGQPSLPIIAFDRSRIFANALFGVALTEKLESLELELSVENSQIASDLEAEELELTAFKETLSLDVFGGRAKDFDEKVVRLRAEQEAKAEAIEAQRELNLRIFEQNLNVVLTEVAVSVGAVAVFERQQLYLMSGVIDVSDEVMNRLNALNLTLVTQE